MARSRGFSGSQRVRVSGVFPARPFLPDARKLLLWNRVWGRERAAGASRGSPQRGSGARQRGRGSPPRQTPSGRTHAAWPEWKARESSCTAHASPQPPGSAPRAGGLRSHFARRPAPQAVPRCAPQSPWPRQVPPKAQGTKGGALFEQDGGEQARIVAAELPAPPTEGVASRPLFPGEVISVAPFRCISVLVVGLNLGLSWLVLSLVKIKC